MKNAILIVTGGAVDYVRPLIILVKLNELGISKLEVFSHFLIPVRQISCEGNGKNKVIRYVIYSRDLSSIAHIHQSNIADGHTVRSMDVVNNFGKII